MNEKISTRIRTMMFLGRQYSIDIDKPPRTVSIPSHEILNASEGAPTGYTCPVRKGYVIVSDVTDPRFTHSIAITCESIIRPYTKRQQQKLGGHNQCNTSKKVPV